MASTSTVEPLSAMEELSPKWLEMRHELMANILGRLGAVEILNSVLKVCTTWWRVCKDPAMWKVIHIDARDLDYGGGWDSDGDYHSDGLDADSDLEALTKQAVQLSSGELIDISISGFGSDELLDYIVLHSSELKSLSIMNCYYITSDGLSRALERLPQLEELYISYMFWTRQLFMEAIVLNCPQLKSLMFDKMSVEVGIANDDDALSIANNMSELRHLELSCNMMTNTGLKAILDGCPHLDTLYIGKCVNIRE